MSRFCTDLLDQHIALIAWAAVEQYLPQCHAQFRDVALYKDGPAAWSGRDAYRRYAEFTFGKLREIGAEVIFFGAARGALIAPPDEDWDEVLLVRYPSAQAFMQMLSAPDYREATRHRTAAIEDSRLIATVQTNGL